VLGGLDDTPPSESAVVGFFDPGDDLQRRGEVWGYQFTTFDLADVARFAAGLAQAEADGWDDGPGDIATRAFAERRFLLSDRLLHWAVPWLDAVGRCYPHAKEEAHKRRDALLELGDRHRPAPHLASGEGIYPPGHDAFGPIDPGLPLAKLVGSLWSGAVVLRATLGSMSGRVVTSPELRSSDLADLRGDLAVYFELVGARWRRLAADHPGSSELWLALAARAGRTAALC
jgi:hypothetical protein